MAKEQRPLKPLISKEEFVKQLEYIRITRERFNNLSKALEALAPDYRCDFFPNDDFEIHIVDLLNVLMFEDPKDSLIDYFIYELDFGFWNKDGEPGKITIGDPEEECVREYDISTPAKLYDALVDINFTRYHSSVKRQFEERDFTDSIGEDDEEE